MTFFSSGRKNSGNQASRFQGQSFKRRLKQASGHKHASKKHLPFGSLPGPLWLKIFAPVAAAALLLLSSPTGPFSLNRIEISGADGLQADLVKSGVAAYLSEFRHWPQMSLLMLSAKNLESYLAASDQGLVSAAVKKRFPRGLQIQVEPRKEKYFFLTPGGNFLVSNDFLVQKADYRPTSTLPRIFLKQGELQAGNRYANSEQLVAISLINRSLPDLLKQAVATYELSDSRQSDIAAEAADGSRYLFEPGAGLEDALAKLGVLLESIDPGDGKRLHYIDMRIKNRGYVCLKGLPCSKNPQPPQTASGTPESGATTSPAKLGPS